MHRAILVAPSGAEVDHINGNGLDNRRSNLRLATVNMNRWNMNGRRSASTYKGVSLVPDGSGMWRARICFLSKKQELGKYDNEADAARAYDRRARELHGEFARLNFPGLGEQLATKRTPASSW